MKPAVNPQVSFYPRNAGLLELYWASKDFESPKRALTTVKRALGRSGKAEVLSTNLSQPQPILPAKPQVPNQSALHNQGLFPERYG